MADDKQNLKDGLEDLLGKAKEGTRKAAQKAEEFGKEAKEKVKEFAEDANEATKNMGNDGKTVAIIAHITIIGWIIALVMNNTNKTEFGSFYIRQVFGILILGLLGWIPILRWIVGILCLILWIMSLISAINGEKKPVFLLGEQFQEWFKSL